MVVMIHVPAAWHLSHTAGGRGGEGVTAAATHTNISSHTHTHTLLVVASCSWLAPRRKNLSL